MQVVTWNYGNTVTGPAKDRAHDYNDDALDTELFGVITGERKTHLQKYWDIVKKGCKGGDLAAIKVSGLAEGI
jgi:hypothetical protein